MSRISPELRGEARFAAHRDDLRSSGARVDEAPACAVGLESARRRPRAVGLESTRRRPRAVMSPESPGPASRKRAVTTCTFRRFRRLREPHTPAACRRGWSRQAQRSGSSTSRRAGSSSCRCAPRRGRPGERRPPARRAVRGCGRPRPACPAPGARAGVERTLERLEPARRYRVVERDHEVRRGSGGEPRLDDVARGEQVGERDRAKVVPDGRSRAGRRSLESRDAQGVFRPRFDAIADQPRRRASPSRVKPWRTRLDRRSRPAQPAYRPRPARLPWPPDPAPRPMRTDAPPHRPPGPPRDRDSAGNRRYARPARLRRAPPASGCRNRPVRCRRHTAPAGRSERIGGNRRRCPRDRTGRTHRFRLLDDQLPLRTRRGQGGALRHAVATDLPKDEVGRVAQPPRLRLERSRIEKAGRHPECSGQCVERGLVRLEVDGEHPRHRLARQPGPSRQARASAMTSSGAAPRSQPMPTARCLGR